VDLNSANFFNFQLSDRHADCLGFLDLIFMMLGQMKNVWSLAAAGLMLAQTLGYADEIVYDNTKAYLGQVRYNSFEYGDEIRLGGTARTVTTFLFQYYSEFIANGNETFKVKFYANDGSVYSPGYVRPGTLLFETGFQPVLSGFQSHTFSGLNFTAPDNMTFTVQFFNISQTPTDRAGLVYYGPPTVGSSFDDFWSRNGEGVFTPYNTSDLKDNFAARVIAVPEPGVLAIGAAGVALLALARRRNRR